MHVVLVGNGIAGVTAARHVRKADSSARITLVSGETREPFARTALMYIYMGVLTQRHTWLYEERFWEENRIGRVVGQARGLDAARGVLDVDGESMAYDRLLIATGSTPVLPDWPGVGLAGVQGLYHLSDLDRMEAATVGVAEHLGSDTFLHVQSDVGPLTVRGDGEIAAMALGASLWGTAAQTNEAERCLRKCVHIGGKYGYSSLHWPADSPIFDKVGGSGLTGVDWANAIMVTQNGVRFYDETADDYDFLAAAMASKDTEGKRNGGGPIWAIFDSDAVERQGWDPTPPNVDPNGYFYSADTIGELAARIENEHQPYPMPAGALEETMARYNASAEAGVDEDFGKPTPLYKIQTPPFYAAWSTPLIHDSYSGLRTNANSQVMDLQGEVIEGLYASGECQGGFNQHGLGRSLVFGRIAGRHAAESRAGGG